MLKALFGPSFSAATLKAQLTGGIHRIKLQRQKKLNEVRVERREVAKALRERKFDAARVRVEGIIRKERALEAGEMLEQMFEILLNTVSVIAQSRVCPADMEEVVQSLIWAAPYSQVDEHRIIREQLVAKFGKEFAAAAVRGSGPACRVSPGLMALLSSGPIPDTVKVQSLVSIATENEVPFDPVCDLAESKLGLAPIDPKIAAEAAITAGGKPHGECDSSDDEDGDDPRNPKGHKGCAAAAAAGSAGGGAGGAAAPASTCPTCKGCGHAPSEPAFAPPGTFPFGMPQPACQAGMPPPPGMMPPPGMGGMPPGAPGFPPAAPPPNAAVMPGAARMGYMVAPPAGVTPAPLPMDPAQQAMMLQMMAAAGSGASVGLEAVPHASPVAAPEANVMDEIAAAKAAAKTAALVAPSAPPADVSCGGGAGGPVDPHIDGVPPPHAAAAPAPALSLAERLAALRSQ